MVKIGMLGGTFDPVHLGHIAVAGAVRESLSLDELLIVPAGQPLLKPARLITPARHRLAMLRLATANTPHIRVSVMEIERPGPSYTVDTIAELKRRCGRKDEIYFILGWGNLAQLPQWREPERLIQMCCLVAVPRPGWPRPDVAALENSVPGISKRVIFLERPYIDISASAIRGLVARGLPIRDLVPGPVADYIRRHKLYIGGSA
jgi:nicotinate-nucleotide adenylyltransferase